MSSGIVSTIIQKCKRCYSCIRECPANAIKVMNGQAVVLSDRCISCGHCVKVCSQEAKYIVSDKEKVLFELLGKNETIAIIAPSFAASFPENYKKLISALREVGFSKVCETAFGADLIAESYSDLYENNKNQVVISSSCPAVTNLIEKYYPELVDNIAKVVSPMIAMGRYLKKNFGNESKIVFIGPCIAKKEEYASKEVDDAIDAVLTFNEIKEIISELRIDLNSLPDGKTDPPYALNGKSFPISGGLLKTAEISSDVLEKKVIVVEGMKNVIEVIKDIRDNQINSKFIDILFCEGCISGPAIDSELNYYNRREKVIDYIEESLQYADRKVWKSEIYNNRDINLNRNFIPHSQRRPMPTEEKIAEILARTNKYSIKDELNCGACGYATCREYAISIAKGLAEEDMCLPYLIEKLEQANKEIKETQEQLHNTEKLASIGQLAAGVAHEINNPLGTILLYSSMILRELKKSSEIGQNVEDIQMIIEEANRCKSIVSNLLNFARHGKLKLIRFNLAKLINECLREICIKPDFSETDIVYNECGDEELIEADRDQLKQVILNLLNNACEAMEESEIKKLNIITNNEYNQLKIEISDSGCGIPSENINKLFTPFFTTKKLGKGTGLGLAISYGIVKMHRGSITVKSKVNEGTTFIVKIPKQLTFSNEKI